MLRNFGMKPYICTTETLVSVIFNWAKQCIIGQQFLNHHSWNGLTCPKLRARDTCGIEIWQTHCFSAAVLPHHYLGSVYWSHPSPPGGGQMWPSRQKARSHSCSHCLFWLPVVILFLCLGKEMSQGKDNTVGHRLFSKNLQVTISILNWI